MTTLVLSPHGHIEHVLYGVDDGETFWAHTEPGFAPTLVSWLDSMRFMMRVEVRDRSAECAVVWSAAQLAGDNLVRVGPDSLGGRELFVARDRLGDVVDRGPRAGTWALEAHRIAAGVPRIGLDTDHRTIPNEVDLLGVAVHLDKGVTGVRRPSPGSTTLDDRRAGWYACIWTAASTRCQPPRLRCCWMGVLWVLWAARPVTSSSAPLP